LRLLIGFILIIAAVFFFGGLLSYPLYSCLVLITNISFQQSVHFSILLTGLLPGIYYLYASHRLAETLGRGRGLKVNLGMLARGFGAGLAILIMVELCLSLLDMRQIDPDLQTGFTRLFSVSVKAVITGFVVSVMEEILYRGAIFTGLARYGNSTIALIFTSLLYGAVHFIDFPPLPAGTAISWFSAFTVLAGSFDQFGDPLILDSLFSLSMLGLLFGLLRWHTGNIILCIGLHAGIVCANKIFSYATDFRPGSSYQFLVNSYDHQTGILASFWLLLACLLYYFLVMKKSSAETSAIQPGG